MMRNILSLDGGGIRGVFSLRILARMETLLREHYRRPDLVLSDYFHYIGGTSTGAIIAAVLSWGASVDEIIEFYRKQSAEAFSNKTWLGILQAKFSPEGLIHLLKSHFSEDLGDGRGRQPALLGTKKLKTRFLCVMRNGTTGAAWVITNAPGARYNQPGHPHNNLNIPLYQLIRASTAAPTFFPPEEISSGAAKWLFVDGAITPYNNPAFIMYLTATLPCYGIDVDPAPPHRGLGWEDGIENLRIISVGTGRLRAKFGKNSAGSIYINDQVDHSIKALIDSASVNQDLACRAIGKCLYGESVDSEVGTLMGDAPPEPGGPDTGGSHERFLYCRYNHEFTAEELASAGRGIQLRAMDSLEVIPFYEQFGDDFAKKAVQLKHLV